MRQANLNWEVDNEENAFVITFELPLIEDYYNEDDDDDDGAVYGEIGIVKDPTWNCQLYSIGNFCTILGSSMSNEEIRYLLLEIRKKVDKRQILLDIPDEYVSRLKVLFEESEIMFMTPYTNGTGSKMTVAMVKPVL